MTAGFTKGKRNYYLYYRCIKHTGVNISGIELHDRFKELLNELSFSETQIKKVRKLVKEKLQQAMSEKESGIATRSTQLTEVNKKIEKLEARLMNDEIESSTYKTWFQKYSSERALLLKEIDTLKKNGNDKWQRLEKLLPELTNIQSIYER